MKTSSLAKTGFKLFDSITDKASEALLNKMESAEIVKEAPETKPEYVLLFDKPLTEAQRNQLRTLIEKHRDEFTAKGLNLLGTDEYLPKKSEYYDDYSDEDGNVENDRYLVARFTSQNITKKTKTNLLTPYDLKMHNRVRKTIAES